MDPITLQEYIDQLQDLFRTKDYSAALRLADRGLELYPENRTVLDFWRLLLLARLGAEENALAALQEALDHGSWFSEVLLRRSPTLQSLQGDPRFEALLARNQEIAESDRLVQYPCYTLRPQGKCKGEGGPCPLLIGLHASGGSVESSIDFWKPAATLGWLVAAPHSSQALMKSIYVWDDRQVAEQEILKDYDSLVENYLINPWQTVLAGHAAGSELAIWLVLRGALQINSFLVIGPSGPSFEDLSEWERLLSENDRSGLRGYFLTGELDLSIDQGKLAILVDTFSQAGIETELEILAAADQAYQPDYDAAIARALNFLAG